MSQTAEFDVAATLKGRTILLIGTTGFVGKVALSMLLRRYPDIGKVLVLVRPGMGNTAEERFYTKVAPSPTFDPLREIWGQGFEDFLRDKLICVPGDIGRPLCNFGDEEFALIEKHGLDCIINSAGLVSFTPSLESAVRINARGAGNVLELARKTGASFCHISTCFVAGRRDGEVWEDEDVVGYYPRKDEIGLRDFDAAAEIADCETIIEQVRARANDRAHIAEFRERAKKSLREQRRNPDDEKTLKLAIARERKMWVARKLTDIGMERSEYWGWTNTYTYTKSLGEQIVLAADDVRSTIVRPAVVESAYRYPFPGWNEGFNTTAPLMYLMLNGQRQIPAGVNTRLDVIPVDHIAAGMIAATAAVIANRHKPVYQLGSSAINPVTAARLVELTGLAVRQHYKGKAEAGEDVIVNRLRSRLESHAVPMARFQRTSAPQYKKLADGLSQLIDRKLPRWGAPRVTAIAERLQDKLDKVSGFAGQVIDLVDLFRPFNYDHNVAFRCDNMNELAASMTPQDQQALPWDLKDLNWRDYWLGSHFPGLLKWVFPVLDDEFGAKPRSVYTYKDLVEMFEATTRLHRHRVALRRLNDNEEGNEPDVYTYERIHEMALTGAAVLHQMGIGIDDRVMLMSENRPEWAICYFAILRAGATVVPVDRELSLAEVENLLGASRAKVFFGSPEIHRRLFDEAGLEVSDGDTSDVTTWREGLARKLREAGLDIDMRDFSTLTSKLDAPPDVPLPQRRADSVASLIYTSGTTGEPKGVMLTHKNITSMVSKLSSVFKLYKSDGLLSVLPLHHTFEFSAGLMMPLSHGSSINYLDDVNADRISSAFKEQNITGMVGVPALWQLFHRKIFKPFSDRGPILEKLFQKIVDGARGARDGGAYGTNLGRLLFAPVHRKFGGKIRLMISGGSALNSEVMKDFRGLGFQLVEGYGMTESSPVLTVTRPNETPVVGSVGRALPGIDVQIYEPGADGIGEVVARGPNVMKGYADNPDATQAVLKDGWLHTGDLGRIDDDGNLFIVGRKKEMILGPSGENVYPDELEELYGDSVDIKELSVVGIPAGAGAETVASLVVPDYERDGSREEIRERVHEHMREVSKKIPLYKRIRVYHLWDHDLPKTATRKIKRREVVQELVRLQKVATQAAEVRAKPSSGDKARKTSEWIVDLLAQVTQKKASEITLDTRLDQLGFDSLMFTELTVALEAAGVDLPDASELIDLEAVSDLVAYVDKQKRVESGKKARGGKKAVEAGDDADDIYVPKPIVSLGRRGLRLGQSLLYRRFLDTEVAGTVSVPPGGGYIVAANHASHLDMGLVKHSLGENGELLMALAAKDYFFEDPIRKAYFENFTSLVPMERHGSLRESLCLAGEVVRSGHILLIFPEGTRSLTGVMTDFKPSLGYLAMQSRCGILPMYLAGTHDALPKGSYLPKNRDVAAHIGSYLSYDDLVELAAGSSRSESYRKISTHVEGIVRRLAPARYEWTLGDAGRLPVAEYLTDAGDAPAEAAQ